MLKVWKFGTYKNGTIIDKEPVICTLCEIHVDQECGRSGVNTLQCIIST